MTAWNRCDPRRPPGACHANGTLYTVFVGLVEHPTCFLEVKNDFVGVSFLDDHLRALVEYVSVESSPDMLFPVVAAIFGQGCLGKSARSL